MIYYIWDWKVLDRPAQQEMIRKAKESDTKKIESLMKSVNGFWDDSWRKDVVFLGIKSSSGLAYVYENNNEIVGFICAHDLGFRGYLSELIVSPSAQKKGIGRKLLMKVETELSKRGCRVLISDVWKNSIEYYKKQGWREPGVKLLRKKL
jgi:ribosomal protein S18 acetylase RimI-like enzyme